MRSEVHADTIILRKYEPGFAPLLFEAARASCSPAFTRCMPWCHADYTLSESESFIQQSLDNWQTSTAFSFAIFDAGTAEFCGGIGLNQPNLAHGYYNLGYWVRSSRQRQGLASRATRRLAQVAFVDLPQLNRLEILTAPDNIASQQTALRAGASREGLLRQRLVVGAEVQDAVLFSLIRSDFT